MRSAGRSLPIAGCGLCPYRARSRNSQGLTIKAGGLTWFNYPKMAMIYTYMYCITLFSFEPRWYEIPPILYVHGTPKWKDVWYETMASRGVSNLQPAAWDALFCQNWLLKDTIGSKNGYGSIPINTIFSGMMIHLPAILFTRGTRFLTHCQMSTFDASTNGKISQT